MPRSCSFGKYILFAENGLARFLASCPPTAAQLSAGVHVLRVLLHAVREAAMRHGRAGGWADGRLGAHVHMCARLHECASACTNAICARMHRGVQGSPSVWLTAGGRHVACASAWQHVTDLTGPQLGIRFFHLPAWLDGRRGIFPPLWHRPSPTANLARGYGRVGTRNDEPHRGTMPRRVPTRMYRHVCSRGAA